LTVGGRLDDLDGRVAVVTGAASGIGLALCERFAAEGMRVVMADVDASALEEAAARIDAEVLPTTVDVRSWDAMDELAARSFEGFGAVHVLCNNAGVQLDRRVWETTRAEWEWLLGVNLGGVVHGLHAFLPRMIASGEPGHVVNTASVGGLLAFPKIAPYTCAKFGVVGLSEGLANDLRDEGLPIGVSVLCPGPVTSMLRENSALLRPGSGGPDPTLLDGVERMPATDVAGMVVDAIRGGRFWILTHPAYGELIRRRTAGILSTGEVVEAALL
jgi:NAD(P)-dependent dehydrogenase (short-subunit alcohol dehydrogenase family)